MFHRRSSNYRIIHVMLWSFPYLLWRAFDHWSGFFIGVLVSIMLTALLSSLFSGDRWKTVTSTRQRSWQITPLPRDEEAEVYQQGYRAETAFSHARLHLYLMEEELQSQYEDMLVPYPQETISSPGDRRARQGSSP